MANWDQVMQKNAAMQIFIREKSCYILSEIFVKVFVLKISAVILCGTYQQNRACPVTWRWQRQWWPQWWWWPRWQWRLLVHFQLLKNRTMSLSAKSCWEMFQQAYHYTRHLSVKLEYAILRWIITTKESWIVEKNVLHLMSYFE